MNDSKENPHTIPKFVTDHIKNVTDYSRSLEPALKSIANFTRVVGPGLYATNRVMFPEISAAANISRIMQPYFDLIQRQARLFKSIHNESVLSEMERLKESVKRFSQISNLSVPIPEAIYPNIERLVELLPEVNQDLEIEDSDDIRASLEVTKESDKTNVDTFWTWGTLKWFISLIAGILTALYVAQLSSEQADRHHEEKMEILRTQTKLLEMNQAQQFEFEEAVIELLNSISENLPDDLEDSEEYPDNP